MTEKRPTLAQDGYSKTLLTEGYTRKGGSNSSVSQVQTRPPGPAPMKPTPQGTGTAKPSQSGGAKHTK